jgi:cytochrome b561
MLARMEPTFRYNAAQRALHWAMALIILVAIALGAWAATLPSGVPPRSELLYVHKSLGMLALVLLVVRVAVRALRGAPGWRVPLPPAIRRGGACRRMARSMLLMLAMPVSAAMRCRRRGAIRFRSSVSFNGPILVDREEQAAERGRRAARITGLPGSMGAIVAVHVAAALWHHIVRKDETLLRMR